MNIKLGLERGSVGLLEVLVTMVMVSIGLLALVSLQGTFLSESGGNKARAEAKVMAEGKIEEFKNVSTISDFNLFASGADASVYGQNATFTRSWIISDETNPERKKIKVDVVWGDETITLTSELAWSAVGNASVYSGTGGGAGIATSLPSPGSDAAIVEDLDAIPDDAVVTEDAYGFKLYRNADGQQIVADEEYASGTGRQLRCKHVCLTAEGRIYLEDIGDFSTYEKIRDDDVTVCGWKQDADGNIVEYVDADYPSFAARDYSCYYGGDCTYNPATGDEDYADCPDDLSSYPAINIPGGWRGNIGIVGFSNPTSKTLCFLGEVGGTTRRGYEATRLDADGDEESQEGVNTNYTCHDFLMITNASDDPDACAAYIQIGATTIDRRLASGVSNTIVALDDSSCSLSDFSFTGSVSGTDAQRASLRLMISSIACELGPATGSPSARFMTYTCAVAGNVGDVVTIVSSMEASLLGDPVASSSEVITLGDSIIAPNYTFSAP